jgi:hypothetical protein
MALRLPEVVKETRKCSLAKLTDRLDEVDQETLSKWLESNISSYQIFLALKADGHRIGKQTVYEHRIGYCICGSE